MNSFDLHLIYHNYRPYEGEHCPRQLQNNTVVIMKKRKYVEYAQLRYMSVSSMSQLSLIFPPS